MVVDWIDLDSCESIPGRMFSIILVEMVRMQVWRWDFRMI